MKILWKRGEIAPREQFLLFSTIFYCLLVVLCVKTATRFSLRDKRLFEISEFEITGVDCTHLSRPGQLMKSELYSSYFLATILLKIAIFMQPCVIFHINTCFRNHSTNILNLPFENDFYTSIPSVYQNDVPKRNGFDVCSKVIE